MDNKVKIKLSVLEDVYELAPNLRQDDFNEVSAIGLNPIKSLLRGFIFSDKCFTATKNNKVIGMFGASNLDLPKGFASVWFLGSDECLKVPITFVKEGKKFINDVLQKYNIIINAVDSRNTAHIKWLKHIGVTISNPIIINGFEFLQFYKVKGSK